MPKQIITILVFLLLIGGLFYYLSQRSEEREPSEPELKAPSGEEVNEVPPEGEIQNMKIESPIFENNSSIPLKYTCDGEDVNPPLEISEVLENTKSLVLIVDDPDAPGGTWVHWTVWNISPETEEVGENSTPDGGEEGITDFGKPGYGGPCPPSGTHRYFFKLFALDTILDIDSSSKVSDIEKAMEGHILDQAQLIGLYQRK